MKSIFTIAGILLMTVGGVYGEGSQELDGVKVLQSDERGLEIEVMRSGKRGFFVGIPPEGSIGIQPLDSYGEEIRIAYTGFIRDQRVAKIEIGKPVAEGSSRLITPTASGKTRFRIQFTTPETGGSNMFPTATATATVLTDPFERILSYSHQLPSGQAVAEKDGTRRLEEERRNSWWILASLQDHCQFGWDLSHPL